MERKTRIASIVLNDFRNDSRVLKEARSLQGRGYDVTVVAMHSGELLQHEIVENFKVHRIKLTSRLWSKHIVVQLFKYLEFLFRAVKNYRNADVFHCHDLLALPVGVLGKTLLNRKAKIVYDAHEYETEVEGLSKSQKRIARFFEKRLIHYADAVITVSEPIALEYVRLYGIAKPHLVLNAPIRVKVPKSNILRENLGIREDQKIFLYQGALSRSRGIDLMLETAAQRTSDKIVFVFMGYGVLEPMVREAASNSNNVFLQPAVAPTEILHYSSSADVGVALIQDYSLNNRYMMPNKMFEYVMAGIPLICSDIPEMRRFVETQEVGAIARKLTPEHVNDAIDRVLALDPELLKTRLKSTGETFNWQSQEKVLLDDIYKHLAPVQASS